MRRLLSILFFIGLISNVQAQSFCLQLTEVSNDGNNLIVSLGVQGDTGFQIGSTNLQFAGAQGAFGPATLVSSPLAPPFYFIPTVTQPLPGSYSMNIELAFADVSGAVAAAPDFTEIGQISMEILDPVLASQGLSWEYNGGTTQTVMFLDDEATQLFATSPDCLIGLATTTPPADSDVCEGAIAISEGIFTDLGPSTGASATNVCSGGATNASWYAYTASGTGEVTISSSIDLDQPDTRVSVHSACDLIDCLADDDDSGEGFTSIATFAATEGTTYLIEWDDRWSAGDFDFEVSIDIPLEGEGCTDPLACNFNVEATIDDGSCLIATGCDVCDGNGGIIDNNEIGDVCNDGDPATEDDQIIDCEGTCQGSAIVEADNSTCATAIAIGEGLVLDANISSGGGATNACFTGATDAIFYAYTASADGLVTVSSSIDLDTPDTRVSVHSACDNLDCLAADDDSGEGFTSVADFAATAGTTYIIEWDDRWDAGAFDFEVSLVPSVNGCTDATACNFDETANTDDGSCYFTGDACDDGDATTAGDVWVDCDICAGSAGPVPGCTDAEACNFNAAATEDDGSCLLATGCDACDGAGGVTDNPEIGDACDDGNDDTINDVLTACDVCEGTPAPVAPNALCADAIAIGEGIVLAADISGGAGATNACFAGATNAIYYAYTASIDGDVTVSSSIDLDTPDTRVSVHSACDSLDCLASDDDSGEGFTSVATFAATAGTTYIIEWDDRWDAGEFDFEVSIEASVAGCTDDLACNYNALANSDDGSCFFLGDACDDNNPLTSGDVYVDCEVCSGTLTEVPGCTNELACNYNAEATIDDDSCVVPAGCDECFEGVLIDNPEIGDACDDGDASTIDDIIIECGLCVGLASTADNALCANAIAIGEGVFLGDINGGAGASNACFTGATDAIFYAYTASGSGEVTISSSIDLDEPDTRVSVHSACDLLDCIASDDDGGEGFTSIATFDAVAGTTYIIEWDNRWNENEFDFEVSLITEVQGCTNAEACNYNELAELDDNSCILLGDACDDGDDSTENDVLVACDLCQGTPIPVAENALCADAIAIGEGIVTAADISGGNGATNACFAGATNAIYYAYTASADGLATVSSSIDLDQPDTRVSIHSSCDAIDCITSDDDNGEGFTSIASFDATAGTTYIIEWDDRWDDGEFDFEVSLEPTVVGDCEAIESNVWGIGLFETGSSQYTFVAQNANDAILARSTGDVSIEVFAGECGGESLGTFNNYGSGEIERAVPGNLIAGNTYSYFITNSDDSAIQSKVKRYAVTTIEDNYCGSTLELIDQIYCSREDEMYSNPAVNVVGFSFRFTNQVTGEEIVLTDETTDGFYQQLTTIAGFELGATYDVSARHQVIQNANGIISELWSDYGPACPVTIEGQVPLTNVRDEYCGGEFTFVLADLIKAYPVVGADMYEWSFDNGVEVITHQTVGYPLYLYQVAGLQYGQAYNISVRAHLNGNWGEFGSTCTILMDSQPESTKVRDTHCGLDYAYPSVELLYADFVGSATEYTWEFSNENGSIEFTSPNYKLLMLQPGLETGTYDVRVKAFAGGVYADYGASCSITLNGGGMVIADNVFDKGIENNIEANVYPNPNNGESVSLNLNNLSGDAQKIVINVMDMYGKQVHSEQLAFNAKSFRYELRFDQNLSTGLYLIQIEVDGQQLVEKLIVE